MSPKTAAKKVGSKPVGASASSVSPSKDISAGSASRSTKTAEKKPTQVPSKETLEVARTSSNRRRKTTAAKASVTSNSPAKVETKQKPSKTKPLQPPPKQTDPEEEISLNADLESDDEDDKDSVHSESDGETEPIIAPLPKLSKKTKQLAKAANKKSNASDLKPGVIYISRIPHGFYEEQMRGFFSQFGDINNLRLSRNKKTGRSRHYAFIEFASKEVAAIAAETMNNYLMFGRLLKCKFMQPAEVHPKTFAGANRPFRIVPFRSLAAQRINKERAPEEVQTLVKKLITRENSRRRTLESMGIDYTFPGYAAEIEKAKSAQASIASKKTTLKRKSEVADTETPTKSKSLTKPEIEHKDAAVEATAKSTKTAKADVEKLPQKTEVAGNKRKAATVTEPAPAKTLKSVGGSRGGGSVEQQAAKPRSTTLRSASSSASSKTVKTAKARK